MPRLFQFYNIKSKFNKSDAIYEIKWIGLRYKVFIKYTTFKNTCFGQPGWYDQRGNRELPGSQAWRSRKRESNSMFSRIWYFPRVSYSRLLRRRIRVKGYVPLIEVGSILLNGVYYLHKMAEHRKSLYYKHYLTKKLVMQL